MPNEELQLIAEAKNGSELAKSKLYNRYIRLLYGYLYTRLGTAQDAEDISQETFLRAFKHLDTFAGKASFKNWLFQIAKNIVADHWKDHYKKDTILVDDFFGLGEAPTLILEEDVIVETNAIKATEKKLKGILNKLSKEYQSILEYRFLKGYTIKETAEALNISESNAKVRQFRALKKAQEYIQDISID